MANQGLWRQVRRAHEELKDLLAYLEVEMHDEERTPGCAPSNVEPTGWPALDQGLGCHGIPNGACVEVWGSTPEDLTRFALRWAKVCQERGKNVVLVDPFGEFEPLTMEEAGLAPDQTIILTIQNPHSLAYSLVRLVEQPAVDLVILPSGLLTQRHLQAQLEGEGSGPGGSFLVAIASLAWSARRSRTTLLLLREVPERAHANPYGWSQIRLRFLLRDAESDRMRVRVEQNSFDIATAGRILTISEKEEKEDAGGSLPLP